MRDIADHIADLQKPVSEAQALKFALEDVTWERDVYLDAFTRGMAQEAVKVIGRTLSKN